MKVGCPGVVPGYALSHLRIGPSTLSNPAESSLSLFKSPEGCGPGSGSWLPDTHCKVMSFVVVLNVQRASEPQQGLRIVYIAG